jgi:hypothetical protein
MYLQGVRFVATFVEAGIWVGTAFLLIVFGWAGLRVVKRRTILGVVVAILAVGVLAVIMVWDWFVGEMPRSWASLTGLLLAAIGLFLAWQQRDGASQ